MGVVQKNLNDAAGHSDGARPIPGDGLTHFVRQIALDQGLAAFDKRRHMANLVENELSLRGCFCRTRGGRLFFFSNSERRLLDLDQAPFRNFLKSLTGLAATEQFFKFILDRMHTAAEQAKSIEIRTLSHYDPKTGVLVVSDGDRRVWRREPRGKWTPGLNGADGIFFMTDINADSWEPEFTAGEHLHWYFRQFEFTSFISRLFREDQVTLLRIHLLQSFFPVLRRSRMIPAFLGIHGSGKTTALRLIGLLLVGPRFEVSDVRTDKQDSFIAAVSSRVVLALDNVDSKISWLQDALSRYATGARFEVRRRYSANESVSYEPTALLIISSREPTFRRADVAERVLPFYCGRPVAEGFVPDYVIFDELARRRGAIIGELLELLGSVADRLAKTEPKAVPFRMADFGSFALRLFARPDDSQGEEKGLRLLKALKQAQGDFTSDGDDIIATLRILLSNGGQIGATSVGELFKQCSQIAREKQWTLPRTVQGFGQRLTHLRPIIEAELKARFSDVRIHGNARSISITWIGDKPKRNVGKDNGGGKSQEGYAGDAG